jgi:WD40 repeat protein
MWDPFTLGVLNYMYGHNTSVQDLTLNEERCHLISLGTDKAVKIWDIRDYTLKQTINDKICYRPEDRLTSIYFDRTTNNILVGSRKINLWFVSSFNISLNYVLVQNWRGNQNFSWVTS